MLEMLHHSVYQCIWVLIFLGFEFMIVSMNGYMQQDV